MRTPTTRALVGTLPLLGALAVATSSRADVVQGTRSEQLTESAHTIDLTISPGHATLRVRRTFDNQGARHDQAMVDIDLPSCAVATGLRTLGSLNGRATWFDAELMEAEAAAAKYKELTGVGGYYPKDPALLSWRHATHLKLQVFPVAPKSRKIVEYTLDMPTEYEAGRDVVRLDRLGTDVRAADVVVTAGDLRDKVRVDGKVVTPGAHLSFKEDATVDVVLERHDPPRLGGELAVVPFASHRVLTHARVELSPRLSQAPRGASIVVVMDASRSLTEGDVDAERAAAAAYLSHMPDANVEVITFDRATHHRHGRFAAVATAISDLARSSFVRRNGSAVELALAEAESLLLASPPGPRRVLVLTDERTRKALDLTKLRTVFSRSGAIAHVATITEGSPSLGRTDDGAWADLARATGGVAWHASSSSDPSFEDEMRATFEEWARPIRIDRLTATTPGASDDVALPDSIPEGGSFEVSRIDTSPMSAMVLKGELWSSEIHTTLQPDGAGNNRWSALVFGSGLLFELSEPEQMTLAKLGHAVSPVTSLLAIEPGVRPSTEGLEEGASGSGFGVGHGRIGSSHRTRAPRLSSFDHAAFLKSALAQVWSACGGSGKTAAVAIETTRAEVVDVESVVVDAAAPKSAEACLREGTWAVELPAEFNSDASFLVPL